MIPRSYSEALSAQKAAKERKAKRAAKGLRARKAKRHKSPPRSKLEKEAWDAFSLYIRERDKDKGCISCGTFEGVMQAGHMISRRRRATKYDEHNVNGQCSKCNWADKFVSGIHDMNVIAFINRYSVEIYRALVTLSERTMQHSKADMIALRDTYREKLLTLKASRAQQSEDDRMQR